MNRAFFFFTFIFLFGSISSREANAQGNIIFESNWSTETGTDWGSAIQDDGRWDEAFTCGSGNPFVARTDVLEVIPGSRVGWTLTPNVLQLKEIGNYACGSFQRRNAVPESTSHYGRLYFRNDDTLTTSYHNASYNFVGQIQLVFWNKVPFRQGYALDFRSDARSLDYSYHHDIWQIRTGPSSDPFNPPSVELRIGTWYRYEWHMEYLAASTYRFWPRLYDMQGNLLYDADDFYPSDASPSGPNYSLSQWYTQGGRFYVSSPQLARNIGLGNEGRWPGARTPASWYYAAFALCGSTWCGAVTGDGSQPSPDTSPPTATVTAPTAGQVLAAGTTSTTLNVTTNEAATCRWSTTDQAYQNMSAGQTLSGAGGTSHSATLTGLANGNSYTRFVRCLDTANNAMTTSSVRTFSVAQGAPLDTIPPNSPSQFRIF